MSEVSFKKLNISHFLGIDYGRSKVGLAIANSEVRIAFGYGILKNDQNLVKKIGKIVEKEGIVRIIIGAHMEVRSPIGGRTSKPASKLAGEIEKFGKLLEKELNISVEYQPEIFSTQMAERGLREKGVRKIKRFDDREAARIILQSWLDRVRKK